ncbi:UNVERIFIED_CONTAM: hypothetical protein H355_011501 [Colinus virginianus]|nr:hypothetical protein H355_011501 [Colinus virginianus]
MAVENMIPRNLCNTGLDSQALTQLLRPTLGDKAETLIQGTVGTVVGQWGEETHRQQGLQGIHVSGGQEEGPAAKGQEDSPTASPRGTHTSAPRPNSSSESANREEQPSTSQAVLRGDPSHFLAVHIPTEAEKPHKETEEAAAAGPSEQGSNPSAPGNSPEGALRGGLALTWTHSSPAGG